MINITQSMKAISNTMNDISRYKNDYIGYNDRYESYRSYYSTARSRYYRKSYYATYNKAYSNARIARKSLSNSYDSLNLQLKNLKDSASSRADQILDMKKKEKSLYELQLDSRDLKKASAEKVLVTQAKASYKLMNGVLSALKSIKCRDKAMMLNVMKRLDDAARTNLQDLEGQLLKEVEDINKSVDDLEDLNNKHDASLVSAVAKASIAKLDSIGDIINKEDKASPIDAIVLGGIAGTLLSKALSFGAEFIKKGKKNA